jgi:hypothetical protein
MILTIFAELLPFLSIFIMFISFFTLSYFVLKGEFESIETETLG